MGCATNCVKYVFQIFNLLVLLSGITILIIGILLHLNIIDYIIPISDGENLLEYSALLLIFIGSLVTISTTFGCCGSIRDFIPLLTGYVVILLILFLVQICLGVYVLFEINCETELQSKLHSYLQKTFDRYGNDTVAEQRFDLLQTQLECCGVIGTSDWNLPNGVLPNSCCADNITCTTNTTGVFATGCLKKISEAFIKAVSVTYIIAFCLAAAEVIGIILGLIVISSIRNERRRNRYARYTRR